jgi:tRNA dimethylallyltransferase
MTAYLKKIIYAFFLTGPTATGKTEVAQLIAEKHNYDILSCDSMLIYRDMNIGTDKPDYSQRKKVKYWGIDLVSPVQSFSLWQFYNYAIDTAKKIQSAEKQFIAVGGTGLYIKSLIEGLNSNVPNDPILREQCNDILQHQGISKLQEKLQKQNPKMYEELSDKRNPRRLIRALEYAEFSNKKAFSHTWNMSGNSSPAIPCLSMNKFDLHEKIKHRVENMYKKGLIEEVEHLRSKYDLSKALTAKQAIGYKEALDYLNGICSGKEAIEKTIIRTRQLAKKQITWFRNKLNVHRINIEKTTSVSEIAAKVEQYWEKHALVKLAAGK